MKFKLNDKLTAEFLLKDVNKMIAQENQAFIETQQKELEKQEKLNRLRKNDKLKNILKKDEKKSSKWDPRNLKKVTNPVYKKEDGTFTSLKSGD